MVTRIVAGMPRLTIRFSHAPGVDRTRAELPGDFHLGASQPLPTSAAELGKLDQGLVAQYEISVPTNTPDARVVESDGVSVQFRNGSLMVTGSNYDDVYERYGIELQALSDARRKAGRVD